MKLSISIALLMFLAAPVLAQKSLLFTSASRTDVTRRDLAVSLGAPEVIYEGARIVDNVTVNKEKGLQIHAKFTVKSGVDILCLFIAYFYYDDAGQTPLKTDDPLYRTRDGVVSTHGNFTPASDPQPYEDFQLFIPYSALKVESGKVNQLKFYLAFYDKSNGKFFFKTGWYKFNLKTP